MRTITEYMLTLHKQLMEQREVADSTASAYIRTLYTMNADRPFTNLSWLKNIDSVNGRLDEYAESTQKTILSTIVSSLSTVKDKAAYKKIHTFWYNEMMTRVHEKSDTAKKTPKQEENWLSWDVIQEHEKRLADESAKLVGKDITAGQWDTVLSYMVLALYTEFAPRRNQDYQFMDIVKTPKQAVKDDHNYITTDTKQFIFRKYKTAKTHGEQIFEIPDKLSAAIKIYMSLHPLMRSKKNTKAAIPFLVNADGEQLTAVNAITRILNKIFGKKVGATMLRHIYLSSKYDVREMNEDAEKMGHSSGVQHAYMKDDDLPIPKVATPPS